VALDAEDATRRVRGLLERLAAELDGGVSVEVREADGEIVGRLQGEDAAALIGHRGQTLDAIQHLAYRIAYRGERERGRVLIDAGGYRERRAEMLRAAAEQAAERAVRGGRPVALDPMSALERRLVHEHLKARRDVETYSEGEEPARRLVVAPILG
jgi:spoIIIJ-associated protein